MLKFGEAVQGLGHIVYLRFDIAVPEIAVQSFGINILRSESVEIAVEAFACHIEFARYDKVAQFDDLIKKSYKPRRMEHPLWEGIARIEQHQVYLLWLDAEVTAQYTEIKKQLGIVFFELHAPLAVWTPHLDVEILARFLLHKHSEVGGHEVDTAVDTQLLTDKRRFQNGQVASVGLRIVWIEKLSDGSLYVLGLVLGVVLEGGGIEVRTCAIAENLLLEVGFQRVRPLVIIPGMNNIIERAAGKVTQQNRLRDSRRLHPLEQIVVGASSELIVATGKRGDVDEKVGLDHNEAGNNRPVVGFPAVEQVELHTAAGQPHHMAQGIGRTVYTQSPVIAGCGRKPAVRLITLLNDTSYIFIVDGTVIIVGRELMGQQSSERIGDARRENGSDEDGQRTAIVSPSARVYGFGMIAVATHPLNAHGLRGIEPVAAAEKIHL